MAFKFRTDGKSLTMAEKVAFACIWAAFFFMCYLAIMAFIPH